MSGDKGCLLCSAELTQENTFSVPLKSFKAFLPKLFKYLLIPRAFHGDLSELCKQKMFCVSCGHTIQEVINVQKKIAALEFQIQLSVETMGNSVVAAISALDPKSVINVNKTWSDQMQQLWKKFRYPVVENFAKGLLPSPCVQLEKCPAVTHTLANLCEIASNTGKVKRIKTEPTIETLNEPRKMSSNTSDDDDDDSLQSCPPPPKKVYKEDKEEPQEATRTIDCPSCDYQVPYGPLLNQSIQGARMKVSHHFTRIHNLTKSDDYHKDESTGQDFYPCAFCEFSAFVKPTKKNQSYSAGKQRWYALLKHSRHLMKFHADEFSLKARAESKLNGVNVSVRKRKRESTLRLNKQPELQDGRFHFKCPVANCDFSYISNRSGSLEMEENHSDDFSSANKIRYGLRKIGDHVITIHESSKVKLRDPYEAYIKRNGGSRTLACPWAKCNWIIPVTESVGRSHKQRGSCSYNTFAQHYGNHLFNECEDQDVI